MVDITQLSFDDITHTYSYSGSDKDKYTYNKDIDITGGKKPFGVSHILNEVLGDGFTQIPKPILAYASYRGNGVHLYAERRLQDQELSVYQVFNDVEYQNLPRRYVRGKLLDKPEFNEYVVGMQVLLDLIDTWYNANKHQLKPMYHELSILGEKDNILLAGTCDLVCEYKGNLTMADYKTNATASFKQQYNKYLLQLHLYSWLLNQCYGIDTTHGLIIHVDFDKKSMLGKGQEYDIELNPKVTNLALDIFTNQLITGVKDVEKVIDLNKELSNTLCIKREWSNE